MIRSLFLAACFAIAVISAAAEPPGAVKALSALRPASQSSPFPWTTGTYVYDGAGNITAIGTYTYTYDVLSRIATSHMANDTVSNQAFTYDLFGNITNIQTNDDPTPFLPEQATNHVSGTTYDDAGNSVIYTPPKSAHSYGFKYDAFNMASEETTDGTTTSYFVYSAVDERLRTDNALSQTTHWTVRNANEKVLRDVQKSGSTWSVSHDYVYRGDLLLAALTPAKIEHFSLDHLGSPRVLSDAAGVRIAAHTYLPFGQELGTITADGEPMKFTGHERDSDPTGGPNGLDYMHARYYSSMSGRFLTVDPEVGDPRRPQSWNRYAYARDNPVVFKDPDGKDALYLAFVNYKAKAFGIHVPFTGHAATVTIDSHGHTRLYEYGRYDHPAEKGIVRRIGIPDVVMKNGAPTDASMKKMLAAIAAHEHDYKGKIEGAYFKSSDANTSTMNGYAEGRAAQNSNPDRAPYNTGIIGPANNCATFARDTIGSGGVNVSNAAGDIKPTSTVEDLEKTADTVITFDASTSDMTRTPQP